MLLTTAPYLVSLGDYSFSPDERTRLFVRSTLSLNHFESKACQASIQEAGAINGQEDPHGEEI